MTRKDSTQFILSSKPKIVFFGTPQFAVCALQKLIDEKLSPQLVITAPDKPIGRKQILTPSPVKILAQKNKIPTAIPSKIRDNQEILDKIGKLNPDLLIVAAYGKILPRELLDIPKFGSINVHASILPKYRGASPIQSAILEGESQTGVTIMLMDEKMDEGDIISLQKAPIEHNDTCQSLSERLAEIGSKLLIETIPKYLKWRQNPKSLKNAGAPPLADIPEVKRNPKDRSVNDLLDVENGSGRVKIIFLPPFPQNHSKATYTKIIKKEDGQIDLQPPPKAENLGRMIRAFYPWPGVWIRWQISDGKYQIIKFLPNNPFLIQPEGKRPMTIKEFLNGHPEAKGLIEKLLDPAV